MEESKKSDLEYSMADKMWNSINRFLQRFKNIKFNLTSSKVMVLAKPMYICESFRTLSIC